MKYHSRKAVCGAGHTHDSRKEADRCDELRMMEQSGLVSDLRTQVRIELIPAARYEGMPSERRCDYVADFCYTENGVRVIEDCKGFRTKDYIIKRKLVKHLCCRDGKMIFRET